MEQSEKTSQPSAIAAIESALAKVELSEFRRDLLKVQWLETLRWMDGRATRSYATYTALRLVAILGGVLVPALVAITPPAGWEGAIRITTFVVSLSVATATALESFFRTGDRWRHYRRNAEALRLEGMQYLMLSGPYANAGSHEGAFQEFAARLHGILSTELGVYFTQVAVEPEAQKGRGATAESPAAAVRPQ